MSLDRPGRTALAGAMIAAIFVLPSPDAVANSPAGESLWRQARVDTNGQLSKVVDRRESDGSTITASGTPQRVTLRADPSGAGRTYEITFDAPGPADLVVGQVYPNGRLESEEPYCESNFEGAFQIHELAFDSETDDVAQFSATFHHFCADSVPDGERTVGTVAFEPADGALPLPKYGSLNGQPLTKLSLGFAQPHVSYGERAIAQGVLAERGGDPLANQKVVLSRYAGVNRWRTVDSTQTGARGKYEFGLRPEKIERYRVEFRGSSTGTETTSVERKVYVHYAVNARLSKSRVEVGEPLSVTGRIKPGKRDGPNVILQERVNGSWANVLRQRTRSDGTFQMRIVVNTAARVKLRVYVDARATLLAGASASMRLVAR